MTVWGDADQDREDRRVMRARHTLRQSKDAVSGSDGYDPARWHGRLEETVAALLDYIDEHREHCKPSG